MFPYLTVYVDPWGKSIQPSMTYALIRVLSLDFLSPKRRLSTCHLFCHPLFGAFHWSWGEDR